MERDGMSHDPAHTVEGEIAFSFAQRMALADFEGAFELFAPGLKRSISPSDLQKNFESMLSYADGQVTEIEVRDVYRDEWYGKQAGDLGIVYTAMNGEDFCEAVTVTVAEIAGKRFIRHVEWGRP
jgi:hypothetical protein